MSESPRAAATAATAATRAYRMSAREDAVAETRERILQAAYEQWLERPYDQVTVESVASAAGVSRQTVIRQFGSKDDLAVAVVDWQRPYEEASRAAQPGDVATAIRRLVDRYETMGDANVRMLELEGRVPAIDYVLQQARESHREWVTGTLLPAGAARPGAARERTILALYAATDVTVWKLLRRDLGQPRTSVERTIRLLVDGVIAQPKPTRPKPTRPKPTRPNPAHSTSTNPTSIETETTT